MKANRKYKNSDQTCTRIKIDFTIDSNHITSIIIIMINREKEINKSSVIKELRVNLWGNGYTFDDELSTECNHYTSDKTYEELEEEAITIGKKLFPDFYRHLK